MSPTTDDLRATLREMADEHPAPSPMDMLDELRAVRSARRGRRLWGYGAGVAAAAAAIVVLTQGWGERPDAGLPAGDPGGDPVSRGWVLTDGDPPEFAGGLRLLQSQELGMEEGAQVPAPDPSTPGLQRYAVLWCDPGPAPDDPAVRRPGLVLDGAPVTIPCTRRDGDEAVAPVPLPPPDGGGAYTATWEGDLPRGGEAVVAVYEESSRSGYPFPPVPDPPLTPPAAPEGAVVVDPDSPQATIDLQDAPQGGTGTISGVHAGTATIGADSTLQLWAGGPGTLRVLVDGVWVTDDGDGEGFPAGWVRQDPELRDGGWQAFTPGQRRTLDLPEGLRPAEGETRTVTVAVQPVMGVFPWQVAVTDVGEPLAALPPVTGEDPAAADLPPWYLGFRHAATWELPADGSWQTLAVPAGLQGEPTAWVATCPVDDVRRPPGPSLASVSVDGRPMELGLTCGDTDLALLNLEWQSVAGVGDLPETEGEVRASLPRAGNGAGSGGATGTVSAFVLVPFEEFDHAAAPPPPDAQERLASTFPEGLVAGPTVTEDDLVDGRATLTMMPDTQALTFITEGVGRVRITVDGRDTLIDQISRDGWWTAWTDARTTQLVTGSLDHALQPGDEIVLEVDGYEPGSFTAQLLRAARP